MPESQIMIRIQNTDVIANFTTKNPATRYFIATEPPGGWRELLGQNSDWARPLHVPPARGVAGPRQLAAARPHPSTPHTSGIRGL
jgi:hypothetical protein